MMKINNQSSQMKSNLTNGQWPDLSFLTDAEKQKIIDVINRDDNIRQKQNQIYMKLREEIDMLEAKSLDIPAEHVKTATICVRCNQAFGYFFNYGEICAQCGYKVCQKCKVYQTGDECHGFVFKKSYYDKPWLCILCHKYNQYMVQTGEWIHLNEDAKKPVKPDISGTHLVKISLFSDKKNEILNEIEKINSTKSTLAKRYTIIKKARSQNLSMPTKTSQTDLTKPTSQQTIKNLDNNNNNSSNKNTTSKKLSIQNDKSNDNINKDNNSNAIKSVSGSSETLVAMPSKISSREQLKQNVMGIKLANRQEQLRRKLQSQSIDQTNINYNAIQLERQNQLMLMNDDCDFASVTSSEMENGSSRSETPSMLTLHREKSLDNAAYTNPYFTTSNISSIQNLSSPPPPPPNTANNNTKFIYNTISVDSTGSNTCDDFKTNSTSSNTISNSASPNSPISQNNATFDKEAMFIENPNSNDILSKFNFKNDPNENDDKEEADSNKFEDSLTKSLSNTKKAYNRRDKTPSSLSNKSSNRSLSNSSSFTRKKDRSNSTKEESDADEKDYFRRANNNEHENDNDNDMLQMDQIFARVRESLKLPKESSPYNLQQSKNSSSNENVNNVKHNKKLTKANNANTNTCPNTPVTLKKQHSVSGVNGTVDIFNKFLDHKSLKLHKSSTLNKKPTAKSIDYINSNGDSSSSSSNCIRIKGKVLIDLKYEKKTSNLGVKICCCEDLTSITSKKETCDAYVKIYLLPGSKDKNNKRKTTTKKNTINPVFEENFRYTISYSELSQHKLWISVWHKDKFVGRNKFLGEVFIPLDSELNSSKNWYQLKDKDM